MAFNKSGNGLPGEAEDIMMEEEGNLCFHALQTFRENKYLFIRH